MELTKKARTNNRAKLEKEKGKRRKPLLSRSFGGHYLLFSLVVIRLIAPPQEDVKREEEPIFTSAVAAAEDTSVKKDWNEPYQQQRICIKNGE